MTVNRTPTASRDIARLSFTDGEVIVSPRDMDIFVMSAEKATEACRIFVKKGEQYERFSRDFLKPLHEWCLGNADRVQACYLAVPESHVQVFVVTNSRRFDFDFAEKVAGIELKFATAGWRISVSQLPDADEESLAAFFDPEKALQVYANG